MIPQGNTVSRVHVCADDYRIFCYAGDGIGATKDITIIIDDATIADIIGIESYDGNITLNGNIAVGGTETAVYAVQGTITMTGAVTAQGGTATCKEKDECKLCRPY